MTSQLNVDTIVDKAGTSGPSLPNTTTIKMGNTSTYVSDGGAVTQNLVAGVAKAIGKHSSVEFTHTTNGLNYSTFTDNGTGDHTLSFTNNMTDIHYTITWMLEGKFDVFRFVCLKLNDNSYTTGPRVNTGYFSNGASLTIADLGENGNVVHGDLA
jgi:hypothetical protein